MPKFEIKGEDLDLCICVFSSYSEHNALSSLVDVLFMTRSLLMFQIISYPKYTMKLVFQITVIA